MAFVNHSIRQTQPVILFNPTQYSTINNVKLNETKGFIRPIISSNHKWPIVRPPFFQRFLRPPIIRTIPSKLLTSENNDTIPVQKKIPIRKYSTESSSSLSSKQYSNDEIMEKSTNTKLSTVLEQKSQEQLSNDHNSAVIDNSDFKLKSRTFYILIILFFVFFSIVIILLIVLIIVHR